jgi:hypothetical protein
MNWAKLSQRGGRQMLTNSGIEDDFPVISAKAEIHPNHGYRPSPV